jgi:hypothetical protein
MQITYALDNGVHVARVSKGGDTTTWMGLDSKIYGPDGLLVKDEDSNLVRYNTRDGYDESVTDFQRVVRELNA